MNVKVTTLGSLYQSFWTKIRDEEQHQQAAGEVRNSRQASGQRQTQCAYWWKRRHNIDTIESLLLSQENKLQSHRTVREISSETGGGDPSIFSFADYSLRLKCCKIRRAQQLTGALFSACSLRDDNVITSKPTWKLKHANSILESFEYFCQMTSKSIHMILSYTVSKLSLFLRQCRL